MTESDSSVSGFKKFVNQHKDLLIEIRKSGNSWQYYYEKWVVLGEDDSYWEQYTDKVNKKDKNENEVVEKLIKFTENIDLDKIENRINQFSNAINMIQELMGEFVNQKKVEPKEDNESRPFNLFRD